MTYRSIQLLVDMVLNEILWQLPSPPFPAKKKKKKQYLTLVTKLTIRQQIKGTLSYEMNAFHEMSVYFVKDKFRAMS